MSLSFNAKLKNDNTDSSNKINTISENKRPMRSSEETALYYPDLLGQCTQPEIRNFEVSISIQQQIFWLQAIKMKEHYEAMNLSCHIN